MSHFSVLAVLPHFDGNPRQLHTESPPLAELMAPYAEQDEDYFEFVDKTDDWRQDWQEKQKEVIDEDHYLYEKYDATPGDTWTEHHDLETFDQFVGYWNEGHVKKDGKVGYMANPNAKYDYYRIGGGWRGHLPVKGEEVLTEKSYEFQDRPFRDEPPEDPAGPGDADIAYLADLDRGRLPELALEGLDEYWSLLEPKLNGDEPDGFVDPIYRLLMELDYPIGEEPDAYFTRRRNSDGVTLPKWGPEGPPTKQTLREEYLFGFQWRTHSVIHPEHGWEQKGQMGWFGCDREQRTEGYLHSWPDRLDRYNPDDLLVILDCHI